MVSLQTFFVFFCCTCVADCQVLIVSAGKSIEERMKTQNFEEIMFVSKRAFKRASSTKDRGWRKDLDKIFQLNKDDDNDKKAEKKLRKDFKEAIKKFISKDDRTDKKIEPQNLQYDLFIPEGLFGKDGGISQASSQLLREASKYPNQSVAWGNTNTLSRDYKNALEVAMKTRRPVRFIVYDDLSSKKRKCDTEKLLPNKNMKTNSNATTRRIKLINTSRKELIYRNVERFYHTGRYIPIHALITSIDRCTNLLSQATENFQSIENDFPTMQEDWHLDYALCQLAGYEMDSKRYVTKIEGFSDINNSNNFNHKNKNDAFYESSATTNKTKDSTTFAESLSKMKKKRNHDNTEKGSSKTAKV